MAAVVWAAERPIPRVYRRAAFHAISESTRDDLVHRGVPAPGGGGLPPGGGLAGGPRPPCRGPVLPGLPKAARAIRAPGGARPGGIGATPPGGFAGWYRPAPTTTRSA